MPDYKAIAELFYSFHSEFEAIVMDMVGGKIDKRTLDTMFEDFDSLQEEYHNRLAELYEMEVKNMAKSIIAQDGTAVVNYDNLLAVYVDEDLDDDENVLGYDLVGVAGTEKNAQAIILGSFADKPSAIKAMADMIHWLKGEAFSTFDVPAENEGGEV